MTEEKIDGRSRNRLGRPPTPEEKAERKRVLRSRVRAIVGIMSLKQWHKERVDELATEWGVVPGYVRDLAAEASRHLELLNERDVILNTVRVSAFDRLESADDREYVPIARLLVDTVGGFTQQHKLTVEAQQMPDTELVVQAAKELAKTEDGRTAMRAALAAWEYEAPLLTAGVELEVLDGVRAEAGVGGVLGSDGGDG